MASQNNNKPQGKRQMRCTRRTLLKASAASAALGGLGSPMVARAQAAEFTYKYANNAPDSHPMNVRAKEMAAAIKAETHGRFDLQIFPNNQLGSDTDMLSQLRSGGIRPDPGDAGSGSLHQWHRLCVRGLRHGMEGHGRRSRRLCAR
jgi:TRAP-type C4-dicarboxylate transport system substrate-binding protein